MQTFDSILLVSFGGPEGPEDVLPFLENVLRGKNVPRERMLEVAHHYEQFGGVSPINAQNRALIEALKVELAQHHINLPIYWGNRNWHPLLADTLRKMALDGRAQALAFFTSMFSSYSGCRQYRENIGAAQAEVGSHAPQVQKLRQGFNHPSFIEAQTSVTSEALRKLGTVDQDRLHLLFCAHSIPLSMADNCKYQSQLLEAARLVAERVGHARWELVFQSRSGPPHQPWLEPDIRDRIEELAADGMRACVIIPIGFISDHIEVLYDLDIEAADTCRRLGVEFERAATVGTHPAFVRMIRELIQERLSESSDRPALGALGPSHDLCPENCCLYTQPMRPATARKPNKLGLRQLGLSTLQVSSVGLGCWPMAGITSVGVTDDSSRATIEAALAAGVNFFDTAYSYGYDGRSDRLLREVLADHRDRVILASKVGVYWDERQQRKQDGTRNTLLRHASEVLDRLGVSSVDLMYLHAPDPETPIETSAEAIAEIVARGWAKYAGVSNVNAEQAARFHAICPLTAIQPPFNMLQPENVIDLRPFCRQHSIALVCYWVLMKGLLAGHLERGHRFDPSDRRLAYPIFQGDQWQRNQDFLDGLRRLAAQLGCTVSQLVVAWTLQQPDITVALCGAKHPEQIRDTSQAMRLTLDQATLAEIQTLIERRHLNATADHAAR